MTASTDPIHDDEEVLVGKQKKKKKEGAADPKDQDDEPVESNNNDDTNTKRKRKRKRKRKDKADNGDDDDKKDGEDAATTTTTAADDGNDLEEHRTKTAQVHRTLYLEGLPFSYQRQQVLDFFAEHEITDVVDLRLPVWQDSGRLRGYGHLVVQSPEDYDKALSLSGRALPGSHRYVTIQPAQAPKSPTSSGGHGTMDNQNAATANPSRTVMLHNLSYQATEEDIQAVLERVFSQQLHDNNNNNKKNKSLELSRGGIRVVRHSATGHSKGFAYVEFVQQDDAVALVQHCQQKNSSSGGLVVHGRACRIDYDHGRVRGSFRTADRTLWHKEYNNNNNNHTGNPRQQQT
mmetsp:Transcript_12096/g.26696  ORF Transcript_12096/g.26696 Transcript_12096/m.26696 type:complete len:347 (-) Transcript_12096:136-1176(-)|eukprot:CAMPEP_0168741626 /NCGR_PEP_ID=MMETSP0724-20121128/12617_1 /TAXON_ID=265536 /ORGANISM="Amphiprora sp., Strain CCMP467" /LENGTH=346 /DNA_ID=CAMNT_0008789149 /DNA_START=1 /DNA_END=1041 /DNA_ORIENTATION=+